MKRDIPKNLEEQLLQFAEKHNIEKIILFGSRARGNNTERSDIDIAVGGGDVNSFCLDVKENSDTLLTFDIVDLNGAISEELKENIAAEGIVIYARDAKTR